MRSSEVMPKMIFTSSEKPIETSLSSDRNFIQIHIDPGIRRVQCGTDENKF